MLRTLSISTFFSAGIVYGFGTKFLSESILISSFPEYEIFQMNQIHSSKILIEESGEGDAIITKRKGRLLVVKTADCLPILIRNIENTLVGAIHAGWKGLCSGIIPEAVSTLKRLGFPPKTLEAALGPSIGPCCYEVGKEVPRCFRNNGLIYSMKGRNLALPTTAKRQLIEEGLRMESIHSLPLCTKCHPEIFYSHRRGDSKRMLSFIGLIKGETGAKI